uniref:SPRY domain-containing protein n=1 Tax=Meloidogyne incognita TaxID=6306 RepID=A0A914KYT2_MELIC
MFGELMSENNKQFNELKEIICKKEEKIVCLGNNFEPYFNVIPNKWKDFYYGGYYDCYKCCENKCINADNPKGVCVKGNGFVNLIDEENIKYIDCVKGKGNFVLNKVAFIYAENSFNKPKEYLTNYSLFYFEIKCKIEGEEVDNDKNFVFMGLFNNENNFVELSLNQSSISYKTENKEIKIKFPTFSLNNGDIFGCGLVYPPNNKINEFPFIFFTQNGQLIGKIISLKNFKCDFYKPYVALKCVSVETNFGNNLKEKPFIYKIKNNFNHFSVNFDDEGGDEGLDFDGELTKDKTEINGSAGNVSN